jgi:hypothetical protein
MQKRGYPNLVDQCFHPYVITPPAQYGTHFDLTPSRKTILRRLLAAYAGWRQRSDMSQSRSGIALETKTMETNPDEEIPKREIARARHKNYSLINVVKFLIWGRIANRKLNDRVVGLTTRMCAWGVRIRMASRPEQS